MEIAVVLTKHKQMLVEENNLCIRCQHPINSSVVEELQEQVWFTQQVEDILTPVMKM